MFGRSAAWNASWNASSDASQRHEERVRRGFWPKAKRVAAKLPFAKDLLAAYYAAFDRQTPLQVKAALLGALAYFVLPADAMPDILPLLGYTDDALVLVTALRMVSGHVREEHHEAARQALARELDGTR
ncbi:MAG: DUF1232 domain-containing protein [Rhodospirillales bacterium]|nr:DUF1232 domain-containing protein [Rhodospirillales bacterium]